MSRNSAIEVVEARTHNLKAVSCRIPHGKVTVVTGLSGAGKSSLAFDTVYAEAQRRFVESMSTYARQFLEQMERPPIEAMRGILPAVAMVSRNAVKNARSTVGTITEIQDDLRLLFAHLGTVTCPNGHGTLTAATPQEVADRLATGTVGERVMVVADIARPRKQATVKLRELIRQGYFRHLDPKTGDIARLTQTARWLKAWSPFRLVLGRFRASANADGRTIGAIEEAYRLAHGTVTLVGEESERRFGRALTCHVCGAQSARPRPALFSFNSPLGACSTCQGFGRVIGIDPGRVVPDTSRTLEERPIAPWGSPAYEELYEPLFRACRANGVPLDVPWCELSESARTFVWSGTGSFTSIERFFAWLEKRNYRMHLRVLLSRYRAYDTCPDCLGQRLKPDALRVRLAGETLPELTTRNIEQLRTWLATLDLPTHQRARAGHLFDQLGERLETLHRVGLDYLTLDRQARTLSGGESQRIQLATALGSGLTSTLYVLDEPTIGLHPQDSGQLLALLHDLAARGNTVLVVEHDRTLIEGAHHLIDLGPRAGEHGGEVLAEGTPEAVLRHPTSLTARYLGAETATPAREHLARHRREKRANRAPEQSQEPMVRILGARENNLRGIDVAMPGNALVVVTGVSGSGKSTLIDNVLYGTFKRQHGAVDVEPGDCDGLEGLDDLEDMTLVDQRPIGRSTRSNPVTYVKAYDEIRKLFAQSEDGRRRGVKPAAFSFNVDRGRCQTCKGTGVVEVDMHFMAAVTVTCDDCQGRRFQPEVLSITLRGRTIDETLALTVDTALEVFDDQPRLCRRLQALRDVGLGYLRLGQPTSTLSGGEAQRLKLASFLHRPRQEQPRLFLFDEPTTGLHLADIDLLYGTLRQLISRGHGVIVVEHSLELVARADWVVDLGPGGGVHGGDLLYSGPMVPFLDRAESPTANALRQHLRWRRKRTASRPATSRKR